MEAKIRTLNAIALLWEEHPPFNKQLQSDIATAPWKGEWEEIKLKNGELLRWAQQQCLQNPAFKSKTSKKQ